LFKIKCKVSFVIGLFIVFVFVFGKRLYAEMYFAPRIVRSMSHDGLIFKSLSSIYERFKTPVKATIFTGTIAAFIALFFNLDNLLDMMSLVTLASYSIVSICLIILRYRPDVVIGVVVGGSGGGDNELQNPVIKSKKKVASASVKTSNIVNFFLFLISSILILIFVVEFVFIQFLEFSFLF
jgi:solute carrier family 7 (cationic amino acid transporter), member 3